MSLFGQLAWLELRQQLRGHVLWIVFSVSLLMVLGAAAIDALRLDAAATLGSGPGLIVRVHLIWTLFYLFTAAAFVADAVIRDDQTRFAPLVQATAVPRRTYVLARFAGACAALCLCFMSVPAALLTAPLLPGTDPAWAPPFSPGTYAFALLVLAIPNLLISAALFFALATASRSLTGCFLGAVALLTLYGLQQGGSQAGPLLQLVEPFGFAATGANPGTFHLTPVLAANRLLWAALALLALWLGLRLYLRRPKGLSPREPKQPAATPAARALPPLASPSSGRSVRVVQLKVRIGHELRQAMFTLPFAVLLALGAIGAAANLWPLAQRGAGTPELTVALIQSFQLVPAIVALFFAGELVWSERAPRMNGIIGAAPAPPALLMLAKFVAMALMLFTLALATAATLAALQIAAGRPPDPAVLIGGYILPKSFDWLLFGILAMFLQVLAPSKFAGWGLLVLYMIGGLALDQAGLDDPLYRYAAYPGAPIPPALSGASDVTAYRLLWGGAALVMLAASLSLAGRTAGLRLRRRKSERSARQST